MCRPRQGKGESGRPGEFAPGDRAYSRSSRCTPSLSACWCRRSSCNAHAIVLPGPRRAFSSVLWCVVLCCAVLCCVALRCVVVWCVVLCCVVLCCVVLCCVMLCCVVLCSVALCCVALWCVVLCCVVLCCVVLCCVVLCCVVLCCVVLCCVVLCCVVLCCDVLCCVALRCVALCCVALRCVALYCVVLRCVVLCCGVPKALLPEGNGRDVYPRVQVNGRAVCQSACCVLVCCCIAGTSVQSHLAGIALPTLVHSRTWSSRPTTPCVLRRAISTWCAVPHCLVLWTALHCVCPAALQLWAVGSGQWNSGNALPHYLETVGSATPAMHCVTTCGQRAVELLLCTARLPRGSGQWIFLQCGAIPPRDGGQWNSYNAPAHQLGGRGVLPRRRSLP